MSDFNCRKIAAHAARFALVVSLGCASFGATGCRRAPIPAATDRQFTVRGIIRSAAPDHRTLEIQHETIPDYMPSMTMPFSVRDPKTTAQLKVGDAISCRLTISGREALIDNIVKINADDLQLGVPTPTATP